MPVIGEYDGEFGALALFGFGNVAHDSDDRLVPRCVVERDQRHLPRVVDLRELLHQPRRELRQMLHEAHVTALLGQAREERTVHACIRWADRPHSRAPTIAQRQRRFELRRIGIDRHGRKLTRAAHRILRIVSITSSSLPQREPTTCRRSAIIGAESACGPVAQLVRAEDS